MFGFEQKKIIGLKADINPAPKATIARKLGRYKRVKDAQARAVKKGDTHRAARLEKELESLSVHLLAEREAIEELFGQRIEL